MEKVESLLTGDTELLDDDLFIKPKKKYKILMLSDHPLAPSGVGVQARFLIEGLLRTEKYTFRCLGGAVKHADYRTMKVNDDFIIKPIDGFGTHELIRSLLVTEQPDAILIFTDPRQFIWLWEIEDEIHQICPITYWHVWDNDPYPAYNRPWYESTDLINCLSWKTYELIKPNFPEKTNYIPHAFPNSVFYELPEQEKNNLMIQNFGPRHDWFKVLWVNRNATRKMPADLLDAWKHFLDNLYEKYGHRKAMMIMHTDPADPEGPNLMAVAEMFGLQNHVWFSTDKLQFDKMNVLHNLCDAAINISKNEGFGLLLLSSLQVGRPIVALKTGGQTRQVVDHRDGSENGAAIEPIKRSLVGSQLVPYIYEDFCTKEQIADALMKLHDLSPEEKRKLGDKCKAYVDYEFSYENMIKKWDETLEQCILKFKDGYKDRWSIEPINPIFPKSSEESPIDRDPKKAEESRTMHINKQAAETQKFLQEQLAKTSAVNADAKSKNRPPAVTKKRKNFKGKKRK